MGNHEFNAIAWHTPDPLHGGEHLRRRTGAKGEVNRHQHAAFLREVDGKPELHQDVMNWFLTLPLWLDLPGLRVVHACWHDGYMQKLEPLLTAQNQLTPELMVAASRSGQMEFRTVEGLTDVKVTWQSTCVGWVLTNNPLNKSSQRQPNNLAPNNTSRSQPNPARKRQPLLAQHSDDQAAHSALNEQSCSQPPISTYAALLIESLSLQVRSFYGREFLEEILTEVDLQQVLATPIRADGMKVRLLVEAVQPIAEEARSVAPGSAEEMDAVYVATLLHGIDYCFFPALRGKYDAVDALYSMVYPALIRLDTRDPKAASALRICMRWGNFDEKEFFADWLQARMRHAIDVLDLSHF